MFCGLNLYRYATKKRTFTYTIDVVLTSTQISNKERTIIWYMVI